MKKIIIILGILAIFSSCEKDSKYPFINSPQKPVIAIYMSQNDIKAKIYWSSPINDSPDLKTIDNADISLFKGNEHIGKLSFVEDGKYQLSELKVEENTEYNINIKVPGYGELKGKTISPSKFEATFSLENSSKIPFSVLLTQKFKDNINEENYYYTSLKLVIFYPETTIDTIIPFYHSSSMFTYLKNRSTIFHDKLINGDEYNQEFDIRKDNFRLRISDTAPKYLNCDSAHIIATIRSTNHDYYQYLYDFSNSDLYFPEKDPSDANILHSNIENGYGVFGAYYESSKKLIFKWEE